MEYQARPISNTFSKLRRPFDNPVSFVKPNPVFKPIPSKHHQPSSLLYDPANVLGADKIAAINNAGKIVFHALGDTGGINGTATQDELAVQMENQLEAAAPADAPAFFFHLGDVVYYNGISSDYKPQFYEPYQYYRAPIFAIPGNHDGDNTVYPGDPPDHESSLTGFFLNFCTPTRVPSPESPYRYTMDQPWPYWTLQAPFVTIIGLYSNIDGSLDKPGAHTKSQHQYNWFVDQLKSADPAKCLILAVHHPPFSLDAVHGGYQDILDAIDSAAAASGRAPDAVFTGHVHNYQRFTRTTGSKQCPYVIAGAGGYANTASSMHQLQRDRATADGSFPLPFQTTIPDLILENYNTVNPGFLRITVDAQILKGEYFINSFDNTPPPAAPFDTFELDWKAGKVA